MGEIFVLLLIIKSEANQFNLSAIAHELLLISVKIQNILLDNIYFYSDNKK